MDAAVRVQREFVEGEGVTGSMPEDVAFWYAVMRNAPYQSDKKPPYHIGDLVLRDGSERVTDIAQQKINEDDILYWDGLAWRTLREWFEVWDIDRPALKARLPAPAGFRLVGSRGL